MHRLARDINTASKENHSLNQAAFARMVESLFAPPTFMASASGGLSAFQR